MGKILERIFEIVENKGGLQGRFKLAQITGITQQQASEIKDKPRTIKVAKKAASEILSMDINELLE